MRNGGKRVSDAVVKRLPRYLRVFRELKQRKIERISSDKIADFMGVTASQVRQDFCSFGGFGQQGYGYDVDRMVEEMSQIIGLNRKYRMIIIGAGNIGRALANYKGFKDDGFEVAALFDAATAAGEIGGVPLFGAEELENYLVTAREAIDIAVIAVPKEDAGEILSRLTRLGIRNFWNFAPVELKGEDGVIIENINMSDSLFVLTYMLNR
ncbi:MAG: redox-sensing transcriptional repressor Rex [Clostridiales bacterium]|jgi:redox-sensing transcriptional repressor|nr:redox-sensing transcriptional repressor Rex [Clostridiales bacterium]